MLLDELGIALGREAGDQDAVAAVGHHGMDGHAQAEAVEHGHNGQHLVAGPEEGVGGDDLGCQGVEIAVGQQDALGHAGGAAGIQDGGGVLGLAADLIDLHIFAPAQELLPGQHTCPAGGDLGIPAALGELIAHLHQGLELVGHGGDDQARQVHGLADAFKLVVKLVQGDGGHRAGIPQIEGDLALRRQGVDHVGNGAHHIHGVEHAQGLGRVGHADGDLVTLPDADGLQALGAGVDLLPHFGIGGALAHELIGDVVGIAAHHLLHPAAHGQGGIIQGSGHLGVPAVEPGRFYLSGFTHKILPPSRASPAPPGAPADTSAAGWTWNSSNHQPDARQWSDPGPGSPAW